MEFFNNGRKRSLVLAGSFFLAVSITAFYVCAAHGPTPLVMAGFGAILISGSLSIAVAYQARKEVMIFREREKDNLALSGHLLTVSPGDINHQALTEAVGPSENGTGVEVVTIYAEDKTIRYISPTAESILGYKQIEMIGETDIGNIHPDHRASFLHIFSRLKENPLEKIQVQYAYKTSEGNYVWLESTGSNRIADPAVSGYLLKSHDITARRLEQQAQRMFSKIQALSENSPDLIIRLEGDTITYVNPLIEYYTGKPPIAFLNKKLRQTDLDHTILDFWEKIAKKLNESGGKMIMDMDFPSRQGKRIMQVNAVPEYDDSANLESILMISHDITERKKIEVEIQHQNRKITESINCAKRIQEAILPDSGLVNRLLPDSFILNKPRDVVSGDFPWFVPVRDEIFMAAVDCTGHGVPGALLSLVGYFLLNDIVRSRRITDPGKILDLLDEGVSTTLRPDEETGTKDGMDISLCKINLEERVVEYAGGHRPLYVIKNGVLDEVKGDKFPIGGGFFRNQTNFFTNKIQLSAGDSIYFCSDGYCDQFGGPAGKKFGTRQLREIITKVQAMPMKEAARVFEERWESWKNDQKQTDDVLLIGVKFN